MRTFALALLSTFFATCAAKADLPPRSTDLLNTSWLAAIEKEIEAREYAPSRHARQDNSGAPAAAAWSLSNRAHGFRSIVSERGWEIASDSSWRWSYRLRSLARGSHREHLSAPQASERDGTVSLSYQHGVREWYRNSAAGVEQGFEIPERPLPSGTQELVLVGDIDTDLSVKRAAPEMIVFSRNGLESLQYAGLKVTDATGRVLPSRLSLTERGKRRQINIHIEDAQAAYPVVVDPLATSPAWAVEGGQANSRFGQSVASAGDVNKDGFDDVLVGAPDYTNGHTKEGKVFLFFGSATGLATTPGWTAEADKANSFFGSDVAAAGDVDKDGYADVLVGASGYSNGHSQEGRAYLYHGSASGPLLTPSWIVESNIANAYFGGDVAGAGDINKDGFADALVGAKQGQNGQANEGLVVVYFGSASGLPTVPAQLLEVNQVSALFGGALDGAGDVNRDGFADVIVGADNFANGEAGEGRAFVYLGSASGLSSTPVWTAEGNQAFANFGTSVASAGDVNRDGYSDVIVGANFFTNTLSSEGRAYLYLGSPSGPSTTPFVTWDGGQADASFGFRVASAGDVDRDGYADVLIGAILYTNGEQDEGRVSLFLGSASGPSTKAAWTSDGDQPDSLHGLSLKSAGDVNGDGYSDVAVGTMKFTNGETFEGRASVFLGYGAPGDLNGDKAPDVALLGKGSVAEVVVRVTGTPAKIRVGGFARAADVAKVPGSISSSLVTVIKSGSSYVWRSTSVFTRKSRIFKTTSAAGTPVAGCFVGNEYTPAAFIPNSKSPKLMLYGSSSDSQVALPRGTVAVRCGTAVAGKSAVFSLVKSPQDKKLRALGKFGAKKLFTTAPLDDDILSAGIKLGVVPRGAGKQPTVMVLAQAGKGSALLVRDKANIWRRLTVPGVPAGTRLTDIAAVKVKSATYIVVQLTNKGKGTSYKRVKVPAAHL